MLGEALNPLASPHPPPTADSFLSVEDVYAKYPIRKGVFLRETVGHVHALDGVNLRLQKGEALGLVGESGCGKSTLARVIVQLTPLTSGRVLLEGTDLSRVKGAEKRRIRRRLQLVFQDPYDSLNGRMRVGDIVGEPLQIHRLGRPAERPSRVRDLLQQVDLDPKIARRYPREFSGGQRQRIAIARALAVGPEILILDEPLSAIDVSVQAQILNLLDSLRRRKNLTYLFIAHDIAIVRQFCDRIAVMYLGKIAELGDREQVTGTPLHPYTQALISAVPIPDPQVEKTRRRIRLSGEVPSAINPPTGCRFHTRCPVAQTLCEDVEPPLEEKESGRWVACHFVERGPQGAVAPRLSSLAADPGTAPMAN